MDAPGTRHHLMGRGIERTRIVRDDEDRGDFRTRLAGRADRAAVTGSAWALLPNHVPLRGRMGRAPRSPRVRSLLTGDAGAFSRRHTWGGHLFQNRFTSIVGEAEA